VTALSAAVWGYIGDRANRKLLMLVSTAVWVVGVAGTAVVPSFGALVIVQGVTAVGLGVIASVGFAVVSDLVSPRRRGLAMSFWGLAQGAGTVAGTLFGGVLGAGDWRRPFLLLAGAGLLSAGAYVFAFDTPRGASEPELAPLFDAAAPMTRGSRRRMCPRFSACRRTAG
jgi:MFS family permease